jgi:D-alanyl-D-alanine dipeptidase
VVISIKAGLALAKVQEDLTKIGFSLVVYDAYRPQKAVDHFIRWTK